MHARTVLLLALLESVAVAGVTTSSPPPERLCGLCTEHFDEIAAEHGVDVAVEESSLSVRVFANGSTRWTERVALRSVGGGAIAADHARLERLARAARASRYVLVDDPGSLDVAFDGRYLTATYWVEDAAERVGGVVLFEGFHARPGWRTTMAADRITVTGPAGTAVGNRVPGVRVEGRTVRWTLSGTARGFPDDRTYVAFAQSGGLVGAAVGSLAVGAAAGPPMMADAVVLGAPAAAAVLVLGGIARLLGRRPRDYAVAGYPLSTLALAASAGLSLLFVAGVALGVPALRFLGAVVTPLAVVGLLSATDRPTAALAAVVTVATPIVTALAYVPARGDGLGLDAVVHAVVVVLTTTPVLLGYAGIALLRWRSAS